MENMPMSEGVIHKMDKSAGEITLRHGELYNLCYTP
jgi:Cu/Ag efflux protein CusF